MAEAEVDLAKLFSAVTKDLKGNQAALNQADAYNHNHGDNMVKNFKAITKALKEKPGAPPSEQLAHASQALLQGSPSGSAQLYAQGLAQAAEQLQGQPAVTNQNAMSLVQALLGGQPAAPAAQQGGSGDMMSQLLGSMLGGQPASPAAQGGSEDMMSQLLGSMLGGAAAPQAASGQAGGGFDLNSLLGAGMAYLQASQQGAAPMDALVQALMAGSQMNDAPHHSQSGQLVAGSLISALGSMLGGKKRR